jgi:hypothetical protein
VSLCCVFRAPLLVLLLSPVVTSVAGRNNCGCLDDLFYLCTGVADALGNSRYSLSQARSAEVRVWSRSSVELRGSACHELTLAGAAI